MPAELSVPVPQAYALVPTQTAAPAPKQSFTLPQDVRSLLQVKGSGNNLVAKEVPVRFDSLNQGDVFILDAGSKVYQWNGQHANNSEKRKATELVQDMLESSGGDKANHVTIDAKFEKDEELEAEMFELIPRKKKAFGSWGPVTKRYHMQKLEKAGKDEDVKGFNKPKLYKVEYTTKKNTIKKIKFRAMKTKKSMWTTKKFDSSYIMVMDDGFHVWVWMGKIWEHEQGFNVAAKVQKISNEYRKAKKRPSSLPVSMIKEGEEPKKFKDYIVNKRNDKTLLKRLHI